MKKFFLIVLFGYLGSGCQKNMRLSSYQWSKFNTSPNGSTQELSHQEPQFLSPYFENSESVIKIFDEIVERSPQRWGGAVIDDTYLQKVSSVRGQVRFVRAEFDQSDYSAVYEQAQNLRAQRYRALEIMKTKHLELKHSPAIFEPEVVLSRIELSARPHFQYRFDFVAADGTGVYSMRVSPSFAIESLHRVEPCFVQSRSVIFPFGPRLSQLIETFLSPLLGDGTLSSARLMVSSDDGQQALSSNGSFIFDIEDPRFDQVQAFFFAQKTLKYAEEHWDFNLAFPLKIGLRAGYPKKTNTAYYYKGMIRFGEGDGIGYRNIPRDPSIVTHEVAHAIIDSISGMGTEGEASSINEGFADYLTASLWNNPELGHTAFLKRPYTRTVVTTVKFNERNGGIYHDSGLVSGTFWDIEKELGPPLTQKLALKTIVRLGSNPIFSELRPALMDAAEASQVTADQREVLVQILNHREWLGPVL